MAARRGTQPRQETIWEFFTFPVYFGFAGGALVACLLAMLFPFLFYIMFLVALGGVSFCVAHLFLTGGRKRGVRRKLARAEEHELERRIVAERTAKDEQGVTSKRSRRRRRVNRAP